MAKDGKSNPPPKPPPAKPASKPTRPPQSGVKGTASESVEFAERTATNVTSTAPEPKPAKSGGGDKSDK